MGFFDLADVQAWQVAAADVFGAPVTQETFEQEDEQTLAVNLSPNGVRTHSDRPRSVDSLYKVELQHVSSPQPLLIEKFNPLYMSDFREAIEDVWFRALMRASQQAMQESAAVQVAATRERKRAWACVVQQACAVAVDFKDRFKAMKAMSKARAKKNADRT